MIGGSGLVAIGAVVRATRDVDVLALVKDGVLVSAEPFPNAVAEAPMSSRATSGLSRRLNAGPTGLLIGGLPEGFAERVVPRDYGAGLRVSFASRVDQIFFKLYATADRREPRDFADLRLLQPTAVELRDAARWARTHNMPGPFDEEIRRALGDLGVEDEGRDA